MIREESCPPGDPPAPRRLTTTTGWLLGRAALRSNALRQARLDTAGVRKWHYGFLAALSEFGPATQADLGRRLGVDRSDVVGVLNDLEERGWIQREPEPTDRRRNRITLTRDGRNALRRFERLTAAAEEELLAPLSEPERERLRSLLRQLAYPDDGSGDAAS